MSNVNPAYANKDPQERVFYFVRDNPNCIASTISTDLNIKPSTTHDYLNALVLSGNILCEKFKIGDGIKKVSHYSTGRVRYKSPHRKARSDKGRKRGLDPINPQMEIALQDPPAQVVQATTAVQPVPETKPVGKSPTVTINKGGYPKITFEGNPQDRSHLEAIYHAIGKLLKETPAVTVEPPKAEVTTLPPTPAIVAPKKDSKPPKGYSKNGIKLGAPKTARAVLIRDIGELSLGTINSLEMAGIYTLDDLAKTSVESLSTHAVSERELNLIKGVISREAGVKKE